MFWKRKKTAQRRRCEHRLRFEPLENRLLLATVDELSGQVVDSPNGSTVGEVANECQPVNRTDVDDSGLTTPLDALKVINEINRGAVDQIFGDVDADGALTASDVLRIISDLNDDRPSVPSCHEIEVDVVMSSLGDVTVSGGDEVLVMELNVTSQKEVAFFRSTLLWEPTTFGFSHLDVNGVTMATNQTTFFAVDFGDVVLQKGQTQNFKFFGTAPERSGAYRDTLSAFNVDALPGARANVRVFGGFERTVNVVNWGLPQMLPEPSATITQPTNVFLGQVTWVGSPGLLYHAEESVLAFGGGNLSFENALGISVSGLHYRLPNGSVIEANSHICEWDPAGILYITSGFDSWPAVNAGDVWQIWANGISGLQPLVGVQMITAVHPLGHNYWAYGQVRPISINP
jgi:hypothetical protein